MSLPNSSSYPAEQPGQTGGDAPASARPCAICSKRTSSRWISSPAEAFENAITVVMALGGSTNAVLHLHRHGQGRRRAADHRRLPGRSPTARRCWPISSPAATMSWKISTTWAACPACRRCCCASGLLHGDCLTVTGKTLAENLEDLPDLSDGQKIICPISQPDQEDRPSADSLRQSGRRGRGGQDHRQGRRAVLRPGQGLRLGRGSVWRASRRARLWPATSS